MAKDGQQWSLTNQVTKRLNQKTRSTEEKRSTIDVTNDLLIAGTAAAMLGEDRKGSYKNELDEDKLSAFIKQGADINRASSQGVTILHHACKNNNDKLTQIILDRPETDIDKQDSNGDTALHSAYSFDRVKIIELFGERNKGDPTITNELGNNILHTICCGSTKQSSKEKLESKKLSSKYVTPTPKCDSEKLLSLLMQYHCHKVEEMNVTNNEGKKPLNIAKVQNHKFYQYLLNEGMINHDNICIPLSILGVSDDIADFLPEYL